MQVKIILNNRKQETIEVSHKGFHASVPFGRSVGKHEMPKVDAHKAAKGAEFLWNMVHNMKHDEAEEFLRSKVKEFGANTTLAISYLLYKMNRPKITQNVFPFPLGNVAGGWDKKQIQEYLVVPVGAKSMKEAVEINRDVWNEVGKKLGVRKNDENGWVSKLDDMETLDKVVDTAEDYGCRVGLDMAASGLWNGTHYVYDNMKKKYTPEEQYSYVYDMIEFYDLIYVEDPFHEDEMELSADLTYEVGKECIINGDDLYTTNPARLSQGILEKATNGILIKPDQIGTLSDAERVVNMAHENEMFTVTSHRSGDTEENVLGDLALQWGCQFVKFGVMGPEREAKLNRLVELWENSKGPKMVKLKF